MSGEDETTYFASAFYKGRKPSLVEIDDADFLDSNVIKHLNKLNNLVKKIKGTPLNKTFNVYREVVHKVCTKTKVFTNQFLFFKQIGVLVILS